jgi:hypothetical protein
MSTLFCAAALLFASQVAPPADVTTPPEATPGITAETAPTTPTAVPVDAAPPATEGLPATSTPPPALMTTAMTTTPCTPAPYAATHTVLKAYAHQGLERRATTAVASGVVAAGMIGVGITYYAVARVDGELSRLNAEDTEIAGLVIGGAAVIPAVAMVVQLVMPSAEEARLDAFEAEADHDVAVAAAHADLVAEAGGVSWAALGTGAALAVGGLGAGGLGAYFLLLPHLPNPRGPVTHSTGAELIGGGVTALGVGTALLVHSAMGASTASTQLELLAPYGL